MNIILASASPRRKELLSQIGIAFQVRVSDVEEKVTTTVPHLLVQELSRQKAEAVLAVLPEQEGDVIVIGADTVVACDGRILGKPGTEEKAIEMLSLLEGRAHEVYTGVTLLRRMVRRENAEGAAEGSLGYRTERKSFYEATTVHFCHMSRREIIDYVTTKDPMDKAGAYGIQGLCARYISGIEGDYNNVVGLPVSRLYQEMKDWI